MYLEFPVLQFVSVASRPVAVHPQDDSGSVVSRTTYEVVVDSPKISPSLLQAKQFPQPLHLLCVLEFPNHSSDPSVDML